MLRAAPFAALFAALLFNVPAPAASQERGVLRITVVLVDSQRVVTPVPRHALLISDNPPSAAPRRILTALDGTATVMLRPGNYTVESDRPVAFQGKSYEWRQTLDIAAGRNAVLELTAENALTDSAPADAAEVLTAPSSSATAPGESDPSFLLTRWQNSVVTLWTPTTRASGFIVDARGLVVTSQRAIGAATQVEAQLTPAVKVAARVLVADPARDVAVLWIDREVAAGVRPVLLGCELAARPGIASEVANGQEIFTIGAPVRGQQALTSGTVSAVTPQAIAADFEFDASAPGGPVFAPGGGVIGVTSIADDRNGTREDTPVIRIDAVCDVVASATTKMRAASAPDGTRLPVESTRPFPMAALRDAAASRVGNTTPYQLSSSDFDVALITPVLTYAAQNPSMPASGRGRGNATRTPPAAPEPVRSLTDFGNWSEYVAGFPPVLLVRVTPKLVEGFWTKVARAAVSTQGVMLPPIKRVTSGFSRMRAFCGDAEVTPIHPFTLVQRVSASDAIAEGLYVFDASALGPRCGTVRLELYSQKAPLKADARVVDAKVLEQIWQDFAPHRAETP
jgi:S1-C subfamily serine protease